MVRCTMKYDSSFVLSNLRFSTHLTLNQEELGGNEEE